MFKIPSPLSIKNPKKIQTNKQKALKIPFSLIKVLSGFLIMII